MQHHYDVCGTTFRSFMISRMAAVQSIGSLFPVVYNFFASNSISSFLLKKILRFAVQRDIPSLSRKSLRSLASASAPPFPRGGRKVYLFADEFTNFNEAEIGLAFINLLVRLGYEVVIPKHYESGRAAFSKGMLKRGRRLAIKNVNALKDIITEDSPLVGIEPSAILSFRDEYPDIVPAVMNNDAVKLAANCLLYDEFIMRELEAGRIDRMLFTKEHAKIVLHGHCHQKSMASVEASAKMLSIPVNYSVETLPTGCCGMAGSFGYEKEHYNISMEIGEQVLFPGLRKYPEGVIVSAPGTSCRQQIKDGTGKKAFHPVEILAMALLK
ncbi:Anaerobic glycerol-3-phosphate dehydrogenase subunit C [bioreactor metagenome]|uniref:Anaerobic glycerol-3-phosphate dehydrogenase subunit C n=1 Tax=bioreactor metagenome TaxID=1076179 RepID=A0A644WWU0_9ZZZZ